MMGEPIVILLVEDDPELRRIPVVILTTSAAERDMARAYDAHANSYLTKPVDHEQFQGLLETLGYHWLVWNRRPYEAGA